MNNSALHHRVFEIFEEICTIPHGSGDTIKIADYCVAFAKKNNLNYHRDNANNVIVYKGATAEFIGSDPIILQGHLDMVCQKTDGTHFDFEKDSLNLFYDGDFLAAKDTTLGADNGIAVSYILAILESNQVEHPPIEAVFTTDEEIGMIGASALDFSILKSKRMINLDSEEDDTLTVSCAGGMDFHIQIPFKTVPVTATKIEITLGGLKGGHSGVEIHKNRTNADILAGHLLKSLSANTDFSLLSIDGGNKGNAIANRCVISVCTDKPDVFILASKDFLNTTKQELLNTEPDFFFDIIERDTATHNALPKDTQNDVLFLLTAFPNGVVQMSREIEGLVETSLNLGILKTENGFISALISLRSNKKTGMQELSDKLIALCSRICCTYETSGFYPPWEFNTNSKLQAIYCKIYKQIFNKEPKIAAIHAGLECAVFADKITGLDCVSMGPNLFDVHTVSERLQISSAKTTFDLLLEILKNCK